jgi:hypothetical protein
MSYGQSYYFLIEKQQLKNVMRNTIRVTESHNSLVTFKTAVNKEVIRRIFAVKKINWLQL